MILSLLLPPRKDERKWTLAKQMGVDYCITKAAPDLSGKVAPYDFESLRAIKDEFASFGLTLYGLEGDQFDMSSIKLGLSDRDEWIEKYCCMIRNMGRLHIPLLCYNWMAVVGWYRSRINVSERGGAMSCEFDARAVMDDWVDMELQLGEAQIWDNLFYFLDAVLPIAEAAGVKMALHPDDPPISPFKGVGRILTSPESFDRILERYPSPANGIAFCQATFKIMGIDLKEVSARWLRAGKIFFIHLRDITGDKYHFRETFIDNGETSIPEMLQHYRESGYNGPVRSDHAPAMYGEYQKDFSGGISVGYDILGHLFATGYIKGICDANGIPLL
jgi:mannonate dehydratase